MNYETPHIERSAEYGLLDVVLALLRNLKWLIALPLIAGTSAFYIATLLPKSYTSTAVISAPSTSTESSVLTPTIVDEVLKKFPGPEHTTDERRLWLTSKTTLIRVRNPSARAGDPVMMTLKVTDPNPEIARQIADTVIAAWLATLTPQGTKQERLKARLQETEAEMASVENSIKRFENDTSSQAAEALAILYSTRTTLRKEVAAIRDLIAGTRIDEVLVSQPTLPDVGRSKIPYAGVIAAVFAAFLVSSWAIAKSFMSFQYAGDQRHSDKLAEITRALRFWKRSA